MTRQIRRTDARAFVLAAALALGPIAPALAAEPAAAVAELPAPKAFVTRHEAMVRGAPIKYVATAGETYLKNLAGETTGSIFSFSYVKDGPADSKRPVLFVFNGGPGSSSLWLHMGVVGPRRVVMDRQVNPTNTPPFGVENNPDSLLDVADIVFIDPIGTGFSRALGKGKPEDFYGVDEDAEAVAQFIELWLTRNGRWGSPKFVMGESYGSVRAAVLPRALMGGPFYAGVMRGITLNGIILLGTTLENRDGPPKPDAALMGPVLALPAMAATAWHHGKVDKAGRTLPAFQDEVSRFAHETYLPALRQAAAGELSDADRQATAAKLAAYTGLPADSFGKDLKVSKEVFGVELLADKGLSVGQYDGRYTLPTAQSGGDPVADDPAMTQYVPPFIGAFHQMLRDDLKVDLDRPYGAIVWRDLLQKWNWKRGGVPVGQSFAADLATAMRRTPKLRVLVASGYYDLVTTPAGARHSLDQAAPPAGRITYRNYESGHMLYVGDTAPAFTDDVRALIRAATAG